MELHGTRWKRNYIKKKLHKKKFCKEKLHRNRLYEKDYKEKNKL